VRQAIAIALAGLAALGGPILPDTGVAHAGEATASGTASATVVSSVSVKQTADLDFGIIAANASGTGSVRLPPGGGVAVYSGSVRLSCVGAVQCPTPHAARFEVSGEAGRSYVISAPQRIAVPGTSAAPASGGDDPADPPALWVEELRFQSASRPDAGPAGRLDARGQDWFELGGTLLVPSALPPARYRVSVPVIVSYS
jgi:hypothetical protein